MVCEVHRSLSELGWCLGTTESVRIVSFRALSLVGADIGVRLTVKIRCGQLVGSLADERQLRCKERLLATFTNLHGHLDHVYRASRDLWGA